MGFLRQLVTTLRHNDTLFVGGTQVVYKIAERKKERKNKNNNIKNKLSGGNYYGTSL